MATCPNCQHPNNPGAAFCESCAAPLGASGAPPTPPEGQPTVPVRSGPPAGPPPGPPPTAPMAPGMGGPGMMAPGAAPGDQRSSTSSALVAVLVAVGVLALIAVGVVVWAATKGDGGEDVTTGGTTAPTFEDVTTTATSQRPATTQAPPANPADPTQLPSGLLCRDMKSRGYNYAEAVAYWAAEGRPDRMDEDRNGYPCETVYDTADVVAYWGFDPQGGGNGAATSVYDLPSGLFCRDLRARGFSYADAVAYWNLEGQPSRMVARDLPCETVYPTADVVAYWNQFAD